MTFSKKTCTVTVRSLDDTIGSMYTATICDVTFSVILAPVVYWAIFNYPLTSSFIGASLIVTG